MAWRPSAASHAERKARAYVGRYQLVWHAPTHGLDKVRAGAVDWNDDVRLERFKLSDRMLDILLRRSYKVKSADHRMELRDARHRHRLLDRVDQSHVTARADHDQPAALHD